VGGFGKLGLGVDDAKRFAAVIIDFLRSKVGKEVAEKIEKALRARPRHMTSFDTVSELDSHELTNAVDQANRELSQRFDFKDTGAPFTLKEKELTVEMKAPSEFQLKQMLDILTQRLVKRGIDSR